MIGKKLINTGGAAAAFLPSQHFETVTYTGNGGTQSVGGFINRGAAFTNGYITTPFDRQNIVNLNDKTEDFSISLWVNLAAYGSSNVIFSIDSGAPSYQYIGLVTTSTGVNWVHYPGGADGNTVVSSVNLNEWNHFACVRENSTMKLYKNGSLVGSNPITYANTTFGTAERIVIGKRTSVGDLPLNGKVDQFRVFDKALSSSEVTTLYGETAASTSKSVTDIFGDDSGVALYQLDGNANDTGGVSGYIGSGGIFNGSNSYIKTSQPLPDMNAISFSFWVYTTNTSLKQVIFDGSDAGGNDLGIQVSTTQIKVRADKGSYTLNTITNLSSNISGIWTHFVVNISTSGSSVYQNSSLLANLSAGYNVGYHSDLYIGSSQYTGIATNIFTGKIDEVRVYSDILTLTEVGYLYNNTTASIPTDNLVAHYALEGNALDETGIYSGTASNVTYGYDGTATNVTYQKATDFQPDLVWVKPRSANYGNIIYDSVRGTNKRLFTYTTIAEVDDSPYALTSFDSNGFTVSDITSGDYGVNGAVGGLYSGSDGAYVAWCWKAGGSAVSNTDGTITSQVSANQDAGFSVVSYTGNVTAGATVGHGLSSVPELIIVKELGNTNNWQVYSSSTGATKFLYLNSNIAAISATNRWNDTTPTSTVFTVGDSLGVNRSSGNYIAYAFHSVEGYSKVGSYTGTGAAGNIIETGFEPAFIMYKRTDTTGNWVIHDNERNTTSELSKRLYPNLSDAEQTVSPQDVNLLSNGFEMVTTGGDGNASGGTYIYLAIAADPDVTQPVVEDSFGVATYTGNGSTQTIDTAFKPDLVWVKARSQAYSHSLYDSVRGEQKRLIPDITGAESTLVGSVTSFNTNGFSLGSTTAVNGNGTSYVAWCWKAASSDSTNTDGSITSTVSVNPEAGFSIVKWTADGNGFSSDIGHGLSAAPELIITKDTDSANDWIVTSSLFSNPTRNFLKLNLTNAIGTNSVDYYNLNASTFKVGARNLTSGKEIISYCFHSVTGYQKVGSYNYSDTSVTTGFKPRLIMIKRTDDAGQWNMFDYQINTGDVWDNFLRPNTSDIEASGTNIFTVTDTGFNINYSFATNSTYIYLAIA